MTTLHTLETGAIAVLAIVALFFVVGAYMEWMDRRASKAERERKGEADFQRTVRTDPRKSGRRPPRGGLAA